MSSRRTPGPIRCVAGCENAIRRLSRNNFALWFWVPAVAGTTGSMLGTIPRPRRMSRARFCQFVPPSSIRGRRESRAPIAPVGPVQKSTGVGPQVQPDHPAFPARWFTAYFALSRVTGLSCHPRRRICIHPLDASVGASGPHDFAVRIRCPRL
jgi:hypothetical protein